MDFKLKPLRKRIENPNLLRLFPRWQSNNSPDDLGIIRFGFECFPDVLNRDYGVAGWVRKALYEVLNYTPDKTKFDMCHAICTYRDGSKSTWFGKILPLYLTYVGQYGIYHNEYLLPEFDYIRIRGKNRDRSAEKLENITMELNNPILLELFGELEATLADAKKLKLKSQAVQYILKNNYIWQAIGLNQPSRGALIKGRRPKLDIDDDVETKDNVITPAQRQKNSNEIIKEQLGGLHEKGITIYIGNFVHEDCLMKHLLHNEGWKPQFYQWSYRDKNGKEVPDWKLRFPMEYIKQARKWYEAHPDIGGLKAFMMEYYNVIVSEKNYFMDACQVVYERKVISGKVVNGIRITKSNNAGTVWKPANIAIGADPAISSERKTAAIAVVARTPDKHRYVIDGTVGYLDLNDRYINIQDKRTKIAITPSELELVAQRGMVQEIVRFDIKYNADIICIENQAQQMAWINEVRECLAIMGRTTSILPVSGVVDKVAKLELGLFTYISANKYHVSESCKIRDIVQNRVSTFPDNSMDILDAIFNTEKGASFPDDFIIEDSNDKKQEKTFGQQLDEEYYTTVDKDLERWITI